MSAISHCRGHIIYYDGHEWRYKDNNNLLINENRPCVRCGKYPTPEGYDACLGHINGIESACCGHGFEKQFLLKEAV